jgi:hypothetical protein
MNKMNHSLTRLLAAVIAIGLVTAAKAADTVLRLPALGNLAGELACDAGVSVDNPDPTDSAVAMIISWGEDGFCAPQSAGPLWVACSDIIAPGGDWTFSAEDVPARAVSAEVYSFTAKDFEDLGIENLSGSNNELVADVSCEALFFGVVGDADDYRRFQLAYKDGADFAGIPMDQARGPDLTVGVERACSLEDNDFNDSYAGLETGGLSSTQPDGTYAATLSGVSGDSGGDNSYLYLQNAGPSCTGIELAFDGSATCQVPALAPGETFAFDVAACTGSGFSGDVTIGSGEPLAIVEEVYDFMPPTDPLPEIPPRPDPDPEPVAGSPLSLPILRERANLPACNPVVEVTNPDPTEEAIAVMLVWPEQGQCPPDAAGPLKVECSGVLRPGESWSFFDQYIPTGAVSAEVYSFTSKDFEDLGIDDFYGFNDVAGDIMCESLYFGVVGDADDYRSLQLAYKDGTDFFGLPMDKLRGSDLKAGVRWACEANPTSYAQTIDYAGFAPTGLVKDLTVPDIAGNSNDSSSYLYVQNAGPDCAEVDLDFGAGGQCGLSIAPGETAQYDAATCTGPGFTGSVNISSLEPLAIFSETMDLPPDLSLDVTMLDFESSLEGQTKRRVVEICNNGLGTMKVTSASLSGPPFSIIHDTCTGNMVGRDQCCEIQVAFSPALGEVGLFDERLVIRSNDSEDEEIEVQVKGQSNPIPQIPALDYRGLLLLLLLLASGSFVGIRRNKMDQDTRYGL